MPVRVALLDDDDRFRQRLVQRLAFVPSIEVVAEVSAASELLKQLASPAPSIDVALIDIGLGRESGITVADQVNSSHPTVGILMLTVFEDDGHVLQAIQAGASGYLLKDTPVAALAAAIHEVHSGGVPLSRTIARRILRLAGAPRTPTEPASESDVLSQRELQLLGHIVAGETESIISGRLGISPHTVRTHVKNIYRKLRVRSRAAAVRLAFERGLVDHPR